MKIRFTIPVLLVYLLLATAAGPSMAASAPPPVINHCIANSYTLAYPAAATPDSSAPHLIDYIIPYPPADLTGNSQNCLAGRSTRSEDSYFFIHYFIPYPPANLHGDNSSATHYPVPIGQLGSLCYLLGSLNRKKRRL